MANQKKYVTVSGKALYPYLKTPEVFEGHEIGYTIKVVFGLEDTKKLQKFLLDELEKAKELPEFDGKHWSKDPSIGMGETKSGDTFFRFKKANSFVSKRTGEKVVTSVPIFDAEGTPLPKNLDVGNGSTVKVAFSLYPFNKTKAVQGLSLRLEAVQVLDLVAPVNSVDASSFGFEKEQGFEVETSSDDESPFNEDDTESDF